MTLPMVGETDAGFRAVQRRLAALLPAGERPANGTGEAPLELFGESSFTEPPRLISAAVLEGGSLRARRVLGDAEVGFAAFLDGTQASRILGYADGVPIVHGTVAAVVRIRRNRRLVTWWRPAVARRVYAPLAALSSRWAEALRGLGSALVDTSDAAGGGEGRGERGPASHPFALRDAAIHRVQKDREAAEQALAERWCHVERDPLLIDGGISGSERVAVSSCTVGVVKSHRTLYAEGEALQAVFRLRRGERSSVFRVTSPKRTPVASWYLRLRDAAGRDPMWGLVRVETAEPPRATTDSLGAHADRVSRWVLAEVTPLSLPDSRWDRMVYGVRDCEEFLKAIV